MPAQTIPRPRLLLDGHADTPQRFLDEHWHFTDDRGSGHLNLAAAQAGGLTGEFFAIWPEPQQWRGCYADRTFKLIEAVHREVRRSPEQLALCRSADDILAAQTSGRFAVLLGIEGGHAIESSLDLLRRYFALGVRYMTLTWANSNEWADSSGDLDDPSVPHNGGLTDFGRTVVEEMNHLGMMIDISHVSDATFVDVLATSRAPVIASHSSARALTAAPRNLTDEMIRAIAASDGVIMVNFYAAFIDEAWRDAWNQSAPERERAHAQLQQECSQRGVPRTHALCNAIDQRFAAQLPRPPFRSLIDHIDHICSVAGVNHVGLGSDFDGICALPSEIDSAADLPKIAEALEKRGYSEASIRGVLGENLLRVMRQVEHGASMRD